MNKVFIDLLESESGFRRCDFRHNGDAVRVKIRFSRIRVLIVRVLEV